MPNELNHQSKFTTNFLELQHVSLAELITLSPLPSSYWLEDTV